ncbi:hypothetical protein GQ457_05G000680 [Hibiscus cannabinus]
MARIESMIRALKLLELAEQCVGDRVSADGGGLFLGDWWRGVQVSMSVRFAVGYQAEREKEQSQNYE